MARRSRSRAVKGRPNLIWVATSGSLATISGNSVYDALLIPADWSGTVTEQNATLLRMIVSVYTYTEDETGRPHAENAIIAMGDASEGSGSDTSDISNFQDWPTWFQKHEGVLRVFRLEWDGVVRNGNTMLPVQFSQLPEPVLNLKTPRALKADDSIRLWVGGGETPSTTEQPAITWFCRSLVRIGLR